MRRRLFLRQLMKSIWFQSVDWRSSSIHGMHIHIYTHKYTIAWKWQMFFAYSSLVLFSLLLFALLNPCLFKSSSRLSSCKQVSPVFPGPRDLSLLGALTALISVLPWHKMSHCLCLFSEYLSPERRDASSELKCLLYCISCHLPVQESQVAPCVL